MLKFKVGELVIVEFESEAIKLEIKVSSVNKNKRPTYGTIKKIIEDPDEEWSIDEDFGFQDEDKITKKYTKTKIKNLKIKAKNKERIEFLIRKTR